MTEIGFALSRSTWRLRFGICTEEWSWTPGVAEEGQSSPAQFFDAPSDRYVDWRWGWLRVFCAWCAPWRDTLKRSERNG